MFFSALTAAWLKPLCADATSSDAHPSAAAEAQHLFDEALSLLDQNRAEAACPKFEQSLRLDPGIGTQFQLADCYERIGKRATAYRLFDEVAVRCAALSANEHSQLALQRKAALEGQLQYLALEIRAPLDVTQLSIDQLPVQREKWSERLPIDPGEHDFEARAPGHAILRGRVTVLVGNRVTELTIGPLTALVSERDTDRARITEPSGRVEPSRRSNRTGGYRALAYATTGIGVAGLAVGGLYGLVAVSKKRDSDPACRDQSGALRCDDQAATDLRNEAVTAGNYSTAFFVAGGIVTATGVALLFALPSQKQSSVSGGVGFAPNGAFARLGGKF